jgi:hypothetical protein
MISLDEEGGVPTTPYSWQCFEINLIAKPRSSAQVLRVDSSSVAYWKVHCVVELVGLDESKASYNTLSYLRSQSYAEMCSKTKWPWKGWMCEAKSLTLLPIVAIVFG